MAQSTGLRIFQATGNNQTQIVDGQSNIVHSWPGTNNLSAHISEDGSLFRGMQTGTTSIGGATGRIQKLAFDGTMLWDFLVDGPFERMHHDIEPMPNGNVLVIAWDSYTLVDAIADGRDPATVSSDWWPDAILELQPTGLNTATIVWEWHTIDHVIQDFDPTKSNYGVVGDHPELVDINYPPVVLNNGDWNHANGLDYDPVNDWIIISSREQSEIYLIDHSTTTAEAAGHTGGNHGKGGDILYRWGNPEAYRAGGPANRQLWGQHDPRFVAPGYPGAGHVTVFNNRYVLDTQSAVFELELPLDSGGNIIFTPGTSYGPSQPLWIFTQPGFYSRYVSSAERMPNGNTLVCSGQQNLIFEVSPAGNTVWSFFYPNNIIIFQSSWVDRSLWSDTKELPVGGGQINFDHQLDSSFAGNMYILLASISGTTPGVSLGGTHIPLNFDFMTSAMAGQFNSGIFIETLGHLDVNGGAWSTIAVPPGLIPSVLAGIQMDFAQVIFDASLQPVHASHALGIIIVP